MKTVEQFPNDVDWVKFLDRRRSCFIYHSYIEAEFRYLPEVTGFQYVHHLYKWSGDRGTHYRSATELQRSLEHFLSLVQNSLEKIEIYRDACLEWDATARELIKQFESDERQDITLDAFADYHDQFVQILLHTVTVPYLCLSGINYAVEKGADKEAFAAALELLDPLRSFTTYPQLERVLFPHFWNLISERSGITDHDLIDKLTLQEITNCTAGEQLPFEEELAQRRDWCVFWHDAEERVIHFTYDQSLAEQFTVLQEPDTELMESEITGQVAYPGKVTGTVCRVDNAGDMKKFEEGNVIVSINTSPDLMPVLNKCSAIVSDEGGIMCHAAIVSRELKKPCVIGTKVATQVLNDGDEVEVDADTGIVRKV